MWLSTRAAHNDRGGMATIASRKASVENIGVMDIKEPWAVVLNLHEIAPEAP